VIDEQNNTTPEADLSLSKPALKPEANLEIPANKYPVSIADELAALPNLAEQTIVDFGKAAKEGKWTLPEAATQKTGLWASAGKGAITAIASLGEAVGAVGKEYAPEGFIKGHLEGMEYHWGNVAALNAPDSDLRDKSIMENPEIALSPRWWAHGVGQIVPSMALTIAGGGLGAGAASAAAGTGFRAGTSGILTRAVASGSTAKLRAAQKLGAQIGAGLTGGSMEGLHTASEVFDRGGSKLDAGVAFAGVTALSGALNAIGLDFILNPKTGQSAILGSMKAALGEGITEYLEEPTEAGVLILTDQFIDLENQFIEEGYGTLMTDALKRIDAGILSLPLGAFGGGVQVKRYAKAGKKDSTLKVKVSEEDGQADEVTGVEALEGVGGASEPLIAEPDTQTRAEEIELPSYEIGEGASTPAFNYKVTREAFLESGGNPVKQSARSRSYVKGVQKSLREKLNQPDLEISAPDILPEHGAFGAYTGALGLETIFVETGEGQRGFDEAFISQEKGQTPVLLVNVKSKDSLRAAGSHGIYHFVEKYFKSEGLEMENSLKKTLTKYLERGLRGDVKGIDASFFEDEKAG